MRKLSKLIGLTYEGWGRLSSGRVLYDGGSPSSDPGASGSDPAPGGGGAPAFNPADNSFAQHMPEDIRSAFDTVPNLEALGRGYLSGQKMLGVPADQIMRRPTEGDNDAMTKFLRDLGSPDSADGFDLSKIFAGKDHNKEFVGAYLGRASELGLLPHQAEGLASFMMDEMGKAGQQQTAAQQATVAQNVEQLAQQWGVEKDSPAWREKTQTAMSFIDKVAGTKAEAVLVKLEEAGLADDADILVMLEKAGRAMNGRTLEDTTGDPANLGEAATVQQRITDLDAEINKALDSNNRPLATQLSEQQARLRADLTRLTKAP